MDWPSQRTRPRAENAGPPRRRLRFAVELAVIGGLTVLAWFERVTIGRTVEALPRADWRWLVAALGLQVLSLMGFARTQRLILRAEGVEVSASWMAATTFAGTAISVSLPLVGPEAATAFTFSRFQRCRATRQGQGGRSWSRASYPHWSGRTPRPLSSKRQAHRSLGPNASAATA